MFQIVRRRCYVTYRFHKPLIQVIDDDDRIREMLTVYLTEEGYEVFLSENGLEGLDDAQQLRPDMILLDLRLPGRPGEEVCKAIREDGDARFAQTPILMVTGKIADVDRVIGMVVGATGYLPKPFELSVLLQEVHRCLGPRGGEAKQAA